MNALLYGNLTLDENITESGTYHGAGGSVYFIAKIFESLECISTIASPYNKEFPTTLLTKTSFIPATPNEGPMLIFRNNNRPEGRIQHALNTEAANLKPLNTIVTEIVAQDICIVASLLPNISSTELSRMNLLFPQAVKLLLPQGFFRSIGAEGLVSPTKWTPKKEDIASFDIVIVSEKDGPDMDESARLWSTYGPMVIVTREAKGCGIYNKGLVTEHPAFYVETIIDSTGAGDIFSAGFAYAWSKTHDIAVSAEFANATAALSLRYTPDRLQYTVDDILDFAKRQHREIGREPLSDLPAQAGN